MSRSVFSCAQEGFRQLVCLWVGLCSFLVGYLPWRVLALVLTGCWVVPGVCVKMAASSMPVSTPGYLHHQCSCPRSESHLHLPPQQGLQDLQVSLAQDPMKSLLCFWVPVHTILHVHAPGVKFLFHPVLWGSCNQSWLACTARSSGDYSFWCHASPASRLKSHVWGSELSLLWERLYD